MIHITTEYIAGKEIIECLGTARGGAVHARNIGSDIFAGFKNIVGGEISEYTKLHVEAREQALKRMPDEAEHLSADAVVNVRFNTFQVMPGAAEMLANGTAVRLK